MSPWKNVAVAAFAAALLSSAPVAPRPGFRRYRRCPGVPLRILRLRSLSMCSLWLLWPDWFAGGIFIGAGPWFHGHRGFYGHVDNRYDPHYGYHGPVPDRGAQQFNHFQGNEARDGHGNIGNAGHDASGEHALPGGFHGGGGGAPVVAVTVNLEVPGRRSPCPAW